MALKMVHILDLVLESTMMFFFLSQCLQNVSAAFSDWPRSYYQNAFFEIFVFYFATSHPLDISSRSWQMLCASTRPSKDFPSTATLRLAMRESRPGGCSGWSVSGSGGVRVDGSRRCGVSPGSCVRVDSGWVLLFIKGSHGKSATGFDQRF